MQPVDKSIEEFEQELLFAQDPLTTDAERIQNIVESTYCPADLNKIATECHLLNADQQETLHKLLRMFAHLFDGTLGNWKTDPVDLELGQIKWKITLYCKILFCVNCEVIYR
jgi:hypothetical protein